MWIAKDNDLIILARDTREELEQNLKIMNYTSIEETEEDYQLYDGQYMTASKIKALREAEFNKAFFLTSLGYVRRAVTMADGSKKDFLSDLLPVISMGVQGGTPVNILTYDKPPFDEDVTDWTEYQHQVTVTPQFIQECFLQLSADFVPINTKVENANTTTTTSESKPDNVRYI